jgi:hypothetical protein
MLRQLIRDNRRATAYTTAALVLQLAALVAWLWLNHLDWTPWLLLLASRFNQAGAVQFERDKRDEIIGCYEIQAKVLKKGIELAGRRP